MRFTSHEDPITPKPGVYYDVPFSEYQRWNAFSKSMTSPALRSGRHLEHYLATDKTGPALVLGSLIDCLVLEPEKFGDEFEILPGTYVDSKGLKKKWDLRSSVCRTIKAEKEASGKTVIGFDVLQAARDCQEAIAGAPEFAGPLLKGKKQVSICWVDGGDADLPGTGILCKARIDLLHDRIWDLKSARDASPEGFSRAMHDLNYHVQAGAYTEGWAQLTGERKDFGFAVVETGEDGMIPETAFYEVLFDDETLVAGRKKFRRALRKVRKYLDGGYMGYNKYIEPIAIPQWAIYREFDLHEEVTL
jgi:hypothetical protein